MLSHVTWIALFIVSLLIFITASVLTVVYTLKYSSKCSNCGSNEETTVCSDFGGVVAKVSSEEVKGRVQFTSELTRNGKPPNVEFNIPVDKKNTNNVNVVATNVTQTGFDWEMEYTRFPVISQFMNDLSAAEILVGLSWAVVGLHNSGYGILKMMNGSGEYDWCASPENWFGDTTQTPVKFTGIPGVSRVLLDGEYNPIIVYIDSTTTISTLKAKDRTGSEWLAVKNWTVPPTQIQPIVSTPFRSASVIQDTTDLNRMGIVYMGPSAVTPNSAVSLAWSSDGFGTDINYTEVSSEINDPYTLATARQVEAVVTDDGKVYVMVPGKTSVPVARVFVSPSLGSAFETVPIIVGDYSVAVSDASWSLCSFENVIGVYSSAITSTLNNDTRLFLSDDSFNLARVGIVYQNDQTSIVGRTQAKSVVIGEEWRMYVGNDSEMTVPTILVYVSSKDKGLTWSKQENVLGGKSDSVIGSVVTSQLDKTTGIVSFITNATNSINSQILNSSTKSNFDYAVY